MARIMRMTLQADGASLFRAEDIADTAGARVPTPHAQREHVPSSMVRCHLTGLLRASVNTCR